MAVTRKDQTLTEWLSAFLEAELAGWDDYDADDYDPVVDDEYTDDIDSDILESLIILALSGALAFLLYYRAQRQRRQEEERRRNELAGGQGQGQQAQGQEDSGLFPQPGDPDFMNWVAGGVGH
jgi:SEL1 protein